MAGDWIPVRKGLKDELEVMRIATLTGLSPRVIVSVLLDFWSWCDSVTDDGFIEGVTLAEMSRFCPDVCGQFWDALAQVGWIVLSEEGIVIPNFTDWMGNSAKKRLKEARRKRHYRRGGRNVPFLSRDVSREPRTKSGQKVGLQNRTEENKNPLPLSLDNPEIRELWAQWQAHRREIRKPLTPTAAQRQLAKLAEWGPLRAAAALSHSIANGYQGIYEPTVKPGEGLKSPVSTETPQERAARTLRQRQQAEEERKAAEAERGKVAERLSRLRKAAPGASPDGPEGSDGQAEAPD